MTGRLVIAALAIAALSVWLRGQYAASAQINPQVNAQLYVGGTSGSIRYSGNSSVPMPSEVRHAYWKSGLMPSEVRMNAAALGPLHPGGPLAYLPPPQNVSTSYAGMPVGSPSYGTAGTIRYSSPAPAAMAPSTYVPAARAYTPAPVSAGPINAGPLNSSVRYAR